MLWSIPLLVLWANLHGTATLGVLPALLAVAADAWPRRRPTARMSVLAVLAVASLFASPYAPHLPGYYRTVLFNREFAKYLPDWMPTTLAPATAAFYLLALVAVFAVARAPRTLTLFERWNDLRAARARGRGEARRDVVHPVRTRRAAGRGPRAQLPNVPLRRSAIGASSRFGRRRRRVGRRGVTAGVVVRARLPDVCCARRANTAGANGAVFANGAFSDWLLLKEPSLRGRWRTTHARGLPDGRLADAAAVSIGRYDAEQILRPFDVLALRPGGDRAT